MAEYKSVKVNKGADGWGKYLIVTPTEKRDKVISITGGGIHPLAQKIAELSGGIAVDGFKDPVPNDEVFCVVVDCGGTLRTGLFPKLGIPTVNILNGGPSGPMADFCTEDNYVSGTKLEDIVSTEETAVRSEEIISDKTENAARTEKVISDKTATANKGGTPMGGNALFNGLTSIMTKVGNGIGKIVNIFYSGAKQAVDMMIRNVLPFMALISFLIGLMNSTGFGKWIAGGLTPFVGSLGGLVIFALIIGIPVLSPLLAPGAVVQSILGTMIGTLIGSGNIAVTLALPALFAISVVDACDFIPVAASLGDAKPETSRIAVPAMLFSRFVTAPLAVLVGYVAGIGLF